MIAEMRLDRVSLREAEDAPRVLYEATCILCSASWSGRLTERTALCLRLVGARCGWCRGFMAVDAAPSMPVDPVQMGRDRLT